ncbi:hypothetical protein HELRODRAFT_170872 [Helobdella robusta]|uniref:INTS8 TPR repeats domain-containing protein n=1 Tax=Helobdella robusta TaxID=6412 RepID=T1F3J1_HELRO|nr:hypothetical protein HELRODRAFT_170872 [Helobdella robusta]ESO06847.1 hypothetical protein HELRODRAFT_170872 [Helobdella robusta]
MRVSNDCLEVAFEYCALIDLLVSVFLFACMYSMLFICFHDKIVLVYIENIRFNSAKNFFNKKSPQLTYPTTPTTITVKSMMQSDGGGPDDGGSESFSWFMYLLNENLIEEHLEKLNSERQAVNLISIFLYQAEVAASNLKELNEERDNVENNKIRCLKMLALKAASHLNWNLEYLHKNLSPGFMHSLLVEWIRLTCDKDLHRLPLAEIDVNNLFPQTIIALASYYCWCLKFLVEDRFPVKPPKVPHVQIPGLLDPSLQTAVTKEMVMKIDNEDNVVDVLASMLSNRNVSGMLPIMKSISMKPSNNSNKDVILSCNSSAKNGNKIASCDWSMCKVVSTNEIHCQIQYALGGWYFMKRRYDKALTSFEQCNRLQLLISDPIFMTINSAKCSGYLKACSVENCARVNINRSDSLYEEVLVCNTIRRIMYGKVVAFQFIRIINYTDGLVEFFLKVSMRQYLSTTQLHTTPDEDSPFWTVHKRRTDDDSLRTSNLEQKLLMTYDPTHIHDLILKLQRLDVVTLTDKWRLTNDIQLVLMSSRTTMNQSTFTITLVHILIAKARSCLESKMYNKADELLAYASNKLKYTTMFKVVKLLKWEVLRADLTRVIDRSKVKHFLH